MLALRCPLNDFIWISRPYIKNTHYGIDFGWSSKHGGANQPIYAAADGKVCAVKDNDKTNKSWGNYVKIDHGNNVYTLYGHLRQGAQVKKGQTVKKGELIGYMGNTGHSFGNHLHFELYLGGSGTKYRVNALGYLYYDKDQYMDPDTEAEYHIPNKEPQPEPPVTKTYISVTAKSGVWCRKGIGYKYPKYKAIPYGLECELLGKAVGKANGYTWDKVLYGGVEVYMPNKWNAYITK